MSDNQIRDQLQTAKSGTERLSIILGLGDDEREYGLVIMLLNAANNNERWDVYKMSANVATQEAALALIVTHATSIEEIQKVTSYASDSLLEYIDVKIDFFDISILKNPYTTNKQRWIVVNRTPYELLRRRALGEILDHEPKYADLLRIRAHPSATPEMKRRSFSLMCILPPS